MGRKRQGMYLSPADDAQLVQELERCAVRGRKSDLLRNYALLGYQRALSLCSNPDLAEDHAALNRALAELFAPENAPPDFRSAAEFIKAQGRVVEEGAPSRLAAAPSGATILPELTETAPPPEPAEERPRPKPQWGGLQSLVGGSSKDQASS
jgi:hypothetical protein